MAGPLQGLCVPSPWATGGHPPGSWPQDPPTSPRPGMSWFTLCPQPPAPQSCSRSQNPGPELKGTAGLTVRAGTGCSPKSSCLLTSRYSRSVSFSSWKAVRIWNQGEQGGRGSVKAKRHWEDPGEEGAPGRPWGSGCASDQPGGPPAACRAGLAWPRGVEGRQGNGPQTFSCPRDLRPTFRTFTLTGGTPLQGHPQNLRGPQTQEPPG